MPTPHHSVFLQARCPSCHPTNSVKALKAQSTEGLLKKLETVKKMLDHKEVQRSELG